MADEASSSGDAPPTGFDLNRDFLKPMFCASIDVGGMLPPIPGAVLDPQTLIFGPSTSEASLQAMLTTSFRVLSKQVSLRGVSLLLRCGIDMFYDFMCNQIAAKVMRERLALVVWILGDPWYGLVPHAESYSKIIPKEKITELEELLSAGLRYFSRYTRPEDHFSFLLIGTLPVAMFTSFDENLMRIVNDMITIMQASEDLKMGPPPPYFVVCNILANIRDLEKKQLNNDTRRSKGLPIESDPWLDYVNKLSVERGLPVNEATKIECAREVDDVRQYVAVFTENSTRLVKNKPQDIIKQKALKEFWFSKIGEALVCPLSVLSSTLQDQLVTLNVDRALAADWCSKVYGILKNECVPETDRCIDSFAIAKISRSVLPEEMDFVKVVKTIAENAGNGNKLLIPSFDMDNQIFFDADQDVRIASIVSGNEKWTGISGPKNAGKTHRLLYAVHAFPKAQRDFLWIDFAKIDKDVDGFSRITAQFYFRNCHRVADLLTQLRELFAEVRDGAMVVFDNINIKEDNSGPDEGEKPWRKWSTFLSQLFSLCKEFEDKLRFVVVSENLDPFRDILWFTNELVIPPLTKETALVMASTLKPNLKVSSFVPVDPNALQVASTNLPGEIGALAHACPIGTLRKIARSVAAAGSSPEDLLRAKQLAAESVFANMDGDEKLLASCLFSDLPPFDESMAWAMGRKVLDEDVVRWRVAWNGLIEVGWVTYNSDLGFLISHLPSLILGGKASELPQEQWDIYVNHWVDELVRITLASQECTSVLESFRHNLPHFRHVFESFIAPQERAESSSNSNSKPTGGRTISPRALKEIARKLAGTAGPLLNYCFTPTSGVIVAASIRRELETSPPSDYMFFQKSCIELAEQQFRNNDFASALAIMASVVAPFYPVDKLQTIPDGTPVDAKSLVLYGRLLDISKKRPIEVATAYQKAVEIYGKLGLSPASSKDYSYASRLLDAAGGPVVGPGVGAGATGPDAMAKCGCTVM